jgi:hypothetical protein
MRDVDTSDSELRLLAAVRRSIREHGGEPSSRQVDELLDERSAQHVVHPISDWRPAGAGREHSRNHARPGAIAPAPGGERR